MNLKYSHIDILVEDLEAATAYYERTLGFARSQLQVWNRDGFHVEYYILSNEWQRFMLVHPITGNLRELLDDKGDGHIYRFCFTTDDFVGQYRDLVAAGVQPVNENNRPLSENELESPSGRRIMWLPKEVGQLSVEILEERDTAPQARV